MTGRVAGKVAVVTGANGDLGGATARMLAREGALVAALDLNVPDAPWDSTANGPDARISPRSAAACRWLLCSGRCSSRPAVSPVYT